MAIRILIADDHTDTRRALRQIIESNSKWEVCGEAENGLGAVELAAKLRPDLVILDSSMPKMSGIQAANTIHIADPELPLLLISVYTLDNLQMQGDIRDAGLSGYISKSDAGQFLVEAVDLLLAGKTFFQSTTLDGGEMPFPAPNKPPDESLC